VYLLLKFWIEEQCTKICRYQNMNADFVHTKHKLIQSWSKIEMLCIRCLYLENMVTLRMRDVTFLCTVLVPGNMQIPYIFTCKTFNIKVLYVYAHKRSWTRVLALILTVMSPLNRSWSTVIHQYICSCLCGMHKLISVF